MTEGDRTPVAPTHPPVPGPWWLRLHEAEEGTHALEALLVIAFTVVPCCWALLLLEEVLAEFLGLEVLLLSSPFF